MKERKEPKEKECVLTARYGREIDFLGYRFTHERVMLRKSIKKRFAEKAGRLKSAKRRREVLSSYQGWCKWGNCKNLWRKTIGNMGFQDRGITGRTTTKDGRRFFDLPEKKMMEILNTPIVVTDFESGVKTKMGSDRYIVQIKVQEFGEWKPYKVLTNSFTLKSVLDQARAYDEHLEKLKEYERKIRNQYGNLYTPDKLELNDDDRKILADNKPMLPQQTTVHRRELGGGKYDFYFD